MIDRKRAREIADQWFKDSKEFAGLEGPYSRDEIAGRITIYRIWPEPDEDLWYFHFLEARPIHTLRSSAILIISKLDGRVVYFGSAGDDG